MEFDCLLYVKRGEFMLTYAVFSDKGDRPYNEDSMCVTATDKKGCFVLADGLGGQGKGDVEFYLLKSVSDDKEFSFRPGGNGSLCGFGRSPDSGA